VRWIWEGVFSLDVPDGWEVRDEGGLIEIVPPDPVGAVHISVLKRAKPNNVRDGEATQLAADFARKRGVSNPQPSEITQSGGRLATIAFQSVEENGTLTWDVETRVWDGRVLVCSFCHGGQDVRVRDAALRMLASIQPQGLTG